MSDAVKVLDEIEARLKAATPGDKWLDRHARHISLGGSCWGSMTMDEPDYVLAEHAPADLALLARLVRLAVETTCTGATTGQACILEPAAKWCVPCRIRAELLKRAQQEPAATAACPNCCCAEVLGELRASVPLECRCRERGQGIGPCPDCALLARVDDVLERCAGELELVKTYTGTKVFGMRTQLRSIVDSADDEIRVYRRRAKAVAR